MNSFLSFFQHSLDFSFCAKAKEKKKASGFGKLSPLYQTCIYNLYVNITITANYLKCKIFSGQQYISL